MRTLIALLACGFAIADASANDPAATAPAPAAAKAAPAAAKAPVKPPVRPAAPAISEEEAEADLSARIAQRIATMRAQQAARAAANARARRLADARKKEAVQLAVKPPPPARGTHWSYEGELGPANWSKINVDWAACSNGKRQSPIDIRNGLKVELEAVTVDYKPSTFSVVDNGHTIETGIAAGNFISVGNRVYELVQFHFHRPSEERIDGKGYEMVVHLVHRDPEGQLAVVAVLLERGAALRPLQTVLNNLPLEKGDVVEPSVVIDPAELLPRTREYYTFMGSLTTPPCSEGVLWVVMKQPMQASPAQMALFARMYPLNARPIQASGGRMIKESY
ncbi:MAG TPA: carbonic anhydrase family protein [Telluria sp.]|nr:carbonic anhydrase family protein [Telluria sp.]